MRLPYGRGAYQRNRGDFPELQVVNMFLEAAPTEQEGVTLQSRPGLIDYSVSMGTGEIKGLFQEDGVFGGDLFGVSGSALYRNGTSLGTITGAGHVSFAATELELMVCAGASLHRYNGTTLSTVSFPDSANVIKILYLSGYYIAIRENSQKWYFSADGETWEALDFASAEKKPDFIKDAVAYNDILVLYGSRTTEFWQKTSDPDLPFIPIDGLVYDKGIKTTGCAEQFDNGMVFVSRDNLVYRSDNTPQRISDNGIEERIEASATCRVFTFFFEGHEFCAIRLAAETFLYDASTGEWCEFASHGQTNWLATCAVEGPIFGGQSGELYEFGAHVEQGGPLVRTFTAGFPINGGTQRVNNVRLRVNAGQTPNLTGDYTNPIAELRSSRDLGQTWGGWRDTKLGAQGKYRKRVEWRALGVFDEPGALFEIRCSDPVPFRVSYVGANEAPGGRSR